MSDVTSKTELLAQMQSGYASFEALLAPLSAEQLSEPGVSGDWAIKDILVHLAAWQTRVSLRLEALARSEEAPFAPIDNDEKVDAFNSETFAANRTRPLGEVQAEWHAAAERLNLNVEQTSESDLFKPGLVAALGGDPLWRSVAGNTFEHYAEHAPTIEAWLAAQRA